MRVAISNDLKTLYGRIDYSLMQKTTLTKEYASGSTGVIVLNSAGFSANDYVVIGDPGSDKAEIVQISTISSHQLNFSSGLSMSHDKKSDVYKIGYNQIKFYEDDVLLDTVTFTPDFWVASAQTVDTSNYYHITFYNSTSEAETAAGEKIKGYNRLLCSISDVFQWETSNSIDSTILDKIELATREILSLFINQGQDISKLDNFEVLRIACATLALKYYWLSKRKSENDIATLKSADYAEMYKSKISEASSTINEQEDEVKIFGQTRCDR